MVFKKDESIAMKKMLCNCKNCVDFKFDSCVSEDVSYQNHNGSTMAELPSECMMEEDLHIDSVSSEATDEIQSFIFEILNPGDFAAIYSASISTEVYHLIKINEKGIADGMIADANGHFILPRRKFFKVSYLQKMKEGKRGTEYKLTPGNILVRPEEILVPQVDLSHLNGEMYLLSHDERITVLNQFCA